MWKYLRSYCLKKALHKSHKEFNGRLAGKRNENGMNLRRCGADQSIDKKILAADLKFTARFNSVHVVLIPFSPKSTRKILIKQKLPWKINFLFWKPRQFDGKVKLKMRVSFLKYAVLILVVSRSREIGDYFNVELVLSHFYWHYLDNSSLAMFENKKILLCFYCF